MVKSNPSLSLSDSWGYKTENNSFDGLAGDLERKNIDYGSTPLFVRADRGEVLQYGRRILHLSTAFIFRNPSSLRSVDIFLKPLSLSIWLLTFFCALYGMLFLKFTYSFERRNFCRRVESTWSFLILFTIGAFCQQGLSTIPHLISGRITALFLLLLSLLIYQFYSASLVSHLLVKPKLYIKSLGDLLTSDMKAGCEDVLYTRDYLRYTTDKVTQELYLSKILGNNVNLSNFLNAGEGMKLVQQGGYAFHVELATAYPIISKTFPEKAICELSELQLLTTMQYMYANYQKNSPFKDMFDTCLQRLMEYGIYDRVVKFWYPRKPECPDSKSSLVSIGLEYFYPALMVLIVGMTLSLIILAIEIRFFYQERKQNKDPPTSIYPFTL